MAQALRSLRVFGPPLPLPLCIPTSSPHASQFVLRLGHLRCAPTAICLLLGATLSRRTAGRPLYEECPLLMTHWVSSAMPVAAPATAALPFLVLVAAFFWGLGLLCPASEIDGSPGARTTLPLTAAAPGYASPSPPPCCLLLGPCLCAPPGSGSSPGSHNSSSSSSTYNNSSTFRWWCSRDTVENRLPPYCSTLRAFPSS